MDWESYLPFCQSDRQRELITLRAQGLTIEKVSESMGINKRNVVAMCQRVKPGRQSKVTHLSTI
jgi:transcriptional regulator